jgi:NTE family protein
MHIEAFLAEIEKRFGREKVEPVESPGLSLFDTAVLSLDAMQATIARSKLAAYPPDLLIELPINVCAAHEFYRAREVIEAGERMAERALEQFTDAGP